MEKQELLERFGTPIKVLDQGFVRLVDVLGGDVSVVTAARVTTGKGRSAHAWVEGDASVTSEVTPPFWCCSVCGERSLARTPAGREHPPEPGMCTEGDRRLIRYLLRADHGTPFEFANLVVHLRIPMDAWRQGVRHRTFAINEYSTRYSEAIDAAAQTAPDAWRAQGRTNRQGSEGRVTEWPPGLAVTGWECDERAAGRRAGEYLSAREDHLQRLAREVYEERLRFGVAREQARKDLPLSTYTELYWTANLRNWLHFLELRLDPHAQQEIRSYAAVIWQIVQAWVPLVAEAFRDYRLDAVALSRQQAAALRALVGSVERDAVLTALAEAGVPPGEQREFLATFGASIERSHGRDDA